MPETGQISDGYHTFDELYEHRHALFIALGRAWSGYEHRVWRSRQHADGTMFPGWFIMGIDKAPGWQITYHLPEYLWPQTEFADDLETAPAWDGHTPNDVLARLGRL